MNSKLKLLVLGLFFVSLKAFAFIDFKNKKLHYTKEEDIECSKKLLGKYFEGFKAIKKCIDNKDSKCLKKHLTNDWMGIIESDEEVNKELMIRNNNKEGFFVHRLDLPGSPAMVKPKKMDEYLPVYLNEYFDKGKIKSCYKKISNGTSWEYIDLQSPYYFYNSMHIYIEKETGKIYFFHRPEEKKK